MSEETNVTNAGEPTAPAVDPNTSPNANATPEPSGETQEPTPADAAREMQEKFTLTAEEPAAPEKGGATAEGDQPDETPFQLEFTEGTKIDEGLVGIATKHFKALGADGKAAGACMERIVAEYQEAYYQKMVENDAALKADWGSEYESRSTEVRQFLRAFCAKNSYPLDRVQAISSPDGYRLVWEIMERGGLVSSMPAGLGRGGSMAGDAAWFKAANTPGTPEYASMRDTSDRSAWRERRDKYNRIRDDLALRG